MKPRIKPRNLIRPTLSSVVFGRRFLQLVAFLSSVFFVQVAIAKNAAKNQQEYMQHAQGLLRSEWQSDARYLSCKTVQQALEQLNTYDKMRFHIILGRIQQNEYLISRVAAVTIAESLYWQELKKQHEIRLMKARSDSLLVESEPLVKKMLLKKRLTGAMWRQELISFAKQSKLSEERATKAFHDLRVALLANLGLDTTILSSEGEEFFKKLVKHIAHELFEAAVRHRSVTHETKPATEEELSRLKEYLIANILVKRCIVYRSRAISISPIPNRVRHNKPSNPRREFIHRIKEAIRSAKR